MKKSVIVIHDITKIGDVDGRRVSKVTIDFLQMHAIEYIDKVSKEHLINIHDEELLLDRYGPSPLVRKEIKKLIKLASTLDVAYIRFTDI